ncbi:MAG: SLATT domain-containing protein [Candidatus Hodarchaeota archaeon]
MEDTHSSESQDKSKSLLDSIHQKGVQMKWTEQCHFRKTEKLKIEEKKFNIYLTLLILGATAYSYISLAYKLPLLVNVIAAVSGTFAVILSYERDKFRFSENIRKHRNAADSIFHLVTKVRILRLRIISRTIMLEDALKEFDNISNEYDAICGAAPDIDTNTYKEVQKDFLKTQEVTLEEIKVVFPEY